MKRRNQGKRTTSSAVAISMQSRDADYRGGGPTPSTHGRRCRAVKSDMLTKVALLFVLLPHMAQTKYARGKKSQSKFLLVFPPWRDVHVKTFATKREVERHLHFEPYFDSDLALLIRFLPFWIVSECFENHRKKTRQNACSQLWFREISVHLNISHFLLSFNVLRSFMSFPK